jgi:hypothetical protein
MNAPGTQAPECRFCFDAQLTEKNPLITPCPCKGSGAFVHWNCLKRWVQLNPATNGHVCSICRFPFTVTVFPGLEQVSGPALALFCVRHTYVISSAVSYAQIAWNYKEGVEANQWDMFRTGCFVSQAVYAACLCFVWRVRNKRAYVAHVRRSRILWLLACHAYAFVVVTLAAETPQYMSMIIIYMTLQLYWGEHLRILGALNEELLVTND